MAMTTCPRARSHKLRCSATPLPHDYRQQRRHAGEDPRTEALQDLYNSPVMVYEVRGGRQRRTRLYGPGYQPCQEETETPQKRAPWSDPKPTPPFCQATRQQADGTRLLFRASPRGGHACCSEGLLTYPYTPCCL